MPLKAAIVRLRRVSMPEKAEMLALHRRYFENVKWRMFMHDMGEKDWVIVLRDGPRLVGFSTIQVIELTVRNRPCIFLFSGDTIVDKDHWQSTAMAGSFGHVMLRMIDEHKGKSVHWFLISKGYRTYRFLPVFFNRFYPAHDRRTPSRYADLLSTVAKYKFKNHYDPKTCLVRMAGKKDWLKASFQEIPEARRRDPHVGFFLRRNPGYTRGDELACITDVSRENLNQYAWRVIASNTVAWHE